jgi:cell division protease FtsH
VTIIPRGRAGGVAMIQPDEDRIDRSYSEFLADMVFMLGGRAADLLVFGEPMAGAMSDIQQVTRLARRMVTQFGMSDRLGPVYYRQGEEHVFLGKEIHEGRDFSEGTAKIIDEEIQRIVNQALARASELLSKHRPDLDRLVEALLVHEELDREEVEQVLKGVPPGDLRKTPPPPATAGPEPVKQPIPGPGTPPNPGLAFGV